jgi:hypothetical protein
MCRRVIWETTDGDGLSAQQLRCAGVGNIPELVSANEEIEDPAAADVKSAGSTVGPNRIVGAASVHEGIA